MRDHHCNVIRAKMKGAITTADICRYKYIENIQLSPIVHSCRLPSQVILNFLILHSPINTLTTKPASHNLIAFSLFSKSACLLLISTLNNSSINHGEYLLED
jgi:hypothetical protein